MGILDAALPRPAYSGPPAKAAPATGSYFGLLWNTGTGTTSTIPAGNENAMPVMFGRSFSLDRIGVEVTTLAAATVMRLGLRADDGTFKPGNLITEWTAGGTIDVSTTGIKELTISTAFTAFIRYWLCYKVEGANVGMRGITAGWPAFPTSQSEAVNPVGRYGYERALASGAMLSTWTGNSYGGGQLSVYGRAA